MRPSFLSASCLLLASLASIGACTEPTTPDGASDPTGDGGGGGDATTTNDGGPAGNDGGANPDGAAPAKPVVIGPEVTLATGGAVATYGAWKDKVLYVVFDQAAKTYRVELAKVGGGAPKVLHQGSIVRFESYMFASGSADAARDVLVPGIGTNGATFVVAVPTSAGPYEIHVIDAAAETSTKIDTVPRIGNFAHKNGFVAWWYAQQYTSTAYSGPASLAWRTPSGAIARVAKAWQTPDPVFETSADGSRVAYLAETPTGTMFPPFETSALTVASANGTGAVTLATGKIDSLVFHGNTLMYAYGGVSAAAPGAPSKEIFYSSAKASYAWWIGNDAFISVEASTPNLLTVLPLAGGGRATLGVTYGATHTGKRVFYVPTGTSDLQIADANVPLVAKFTVPDVVEPIVTEDGRWAGLRRGPNTQMRVDRMWVDGKIVDLADKSLGHYDQPNGIQAIASGGAACLNAIFDTVCVTDAGVVARVRANGASFEAAVGANGLLYSSLPKSEKQPRITTVVIQGATLTTTELSKLAVGTTRVSDTAIFYTVSNGTTGSLVARTIQ